MTRIIGGTSGDIQRCYCTKCGEYRPFQNDLSRTYLLAILFALSMITCGLFSPVWVLAYFYAPPNRYQCKDCGYSLPS